MLQPTVDFSRRVACVLGLPFDLVDLQGAVEQVRLAAVQRRPCLVSTANLNFVAAARRNEAFRHSVNHSQLSLADGMPIVWVARWLGVALPERVPGAGLFERLALSEARPALKVYFFGGPDGVARKASDRLNAQPCGLECVGHQSPGFSSVEDISHDDQIDSINSSAADFLVVSLGAQKGQAWIELNRPRLKVPVVSHLGAVVNFAAGELARAPAMIQRLGMEWLWRIKEEPSLWKRYANDAVVFSGLLVHAVLPLWWQRLVDARRRGQGLAGVESRLIGNVFEIQMAGDLSGEAVHALRSAAAEAAASQQRVVVQVSSLSSLDAFAIGTLLLLSGHLRDQGLTLEFRGMHPFLERLFRLHCADFLLEQSHGMRDDRWLANAGPA